MHTAPATVEAGNVTVGQTVYFPHTDMFGTVVALRLSGNNKVGLVTDTVGAVWFSFDTLVEVE